MISLVDLKALYNGQKEALDAASLRVLNSGWYILGNEAKQFEQEFATYCHRRSAIGVANGTDAVELALRGLGLQAGDHVATVSHTAVATVAAIERGGFVPVLVDVDRQRYTMSPESLEMTLDSQVGGKIRAIVPVHIYGQCANMPAIRKLAQKHGCMIVEDCAQAHGARLDGKIAGSMSDAAAFSFYPTKNLGAFGDGGAVVTDDEKIAATINSLRQYGWQQRYISATVGCNSRLDELQAGFLRVRLQALDQENSTRKKLANMYRQSLADCEQITLPFISVSSDPVYHLFVVRINGGKKQRDACQEYLQKNGIGTAIHYPVPIHLQPAYLHRSLLAPNGLPETEALSNEVLSLPMHPYLKEQDVYKVCDCLMQFFATY